MYQIQVIKHQDPFAKFARQDFHGAPTRDQSILMKHVYDALMKGIFYNREMDDYIIDKMTDMLPKDIFMTPEYLAKAIRTEGGPFGYDVYICRKAVESIINTAANREALNALVRDKKIILNEKIKGKIRIGGKNFTSITPVGLSKIDGQITFYCVGRGMKNKYNAMIGANDTRLLALLTDDVNDKTIQVSDSGNGITTTTISPDANRTQEMTAQYS